MQNPNQDPSAKDYYSKADFWDERYQAGGYFDWYAEYPELMYAFQTQYGMTKEDSILMVGCGNSKLSQQMFEAGYKNICNIDISPIVIEQMKLLSPAMLWLVMDATQMTFQNNKFDYVIDKGTMDALIAGRDLTPAIKLLKQCMRVTKEQGQFIQITYGSPEGRKKVFQNSLPFDSFDYYFAYVNLNDMSTMINLMRNNLIGENGQRIEKQVALQKSLKEFMIIKVMRAKRSKQKQFIVWQNFQKKQEKAPSQTKLEVNLQKPLDKQQEPSEKSAKNQNQESNPKQNIKFQSKPQKQSFVYAYSIKRKFGYDFTPFSLSSVDLRSSYQSSYQNASHLQIRGCQKVNDAVARCLQYLNRKKIAHCSVNFVKKGCQFSKDQKILKINIKQGQNVGINLLKKTNIDIKVTFANLSSVDDWLKKLGKFLVERMGLSLHPCPKTYSLFSMIKGRMRSKSTNELLNKYWYPTFVFEKIDVQNRQANIILSVPPVHPSTLDQVQSQIQNYFKSNKNGIEATILQTRNGFLTFPGLNLFNVLNMVSLSYNCGKPLNVFMQDFWNENQLNFVEEESKLFIVHNNHVEVQSDLVPITLLHLLSFC